VRSYLGDISSYFYSRPDKQVRLGQGNFPETIMTDNLYASVVVDIQARELNDRLFTYRIPPDLAAETFIGAQVLVPFGPQGMIGGYVVGVNDEGVSGISIKEIAEVIDSEPLFDRDYVEFLYWIAEYYCASLSDVIAAAVPSDFSGRLKRTVFLNKNYSINGNVEAAAIIKVLEQAKTKSLTVTALRQRIKKSSKLSQHQFYRALNYLRQEGVLTIKQESAQTPGPKLISNVIWTGQEATSSRQKEIVGLLSRHGGQMTLKNLLDQGKTTHATIKRLEVQGLITLNQEEVIRDPLSHISTESKKNKSQRPNLTLDQESVMAILSEDLKKVLTEKPTDTNFENPKSPWLIHGVTGSGKTEIYLRLIEETIKHGRSALLLVPEISLTPQLARRLIDRFDKHVAIWHSALSAGERYDTWRRLRMGDVKVLLGARSAVLANVPNLGLIVIDEEHDGSYKQSSPSPRYDAKTVALEKARRQNALVVLGSATPDVGSFMRAREEGKLLELPKRVFDQALPTVQIVDMREEFAAGNKGIFSLSLQNEIASALSRQEQIILLINRRGYASHVFCRACGHVVKCRQCSVPMVFHQSYGSNSSEDPGSAGVLAGISGAYNAPLRTQTSIYNNGHLACHHCGFRSGAIEICPNCTSPFIRQFGLGTQRVEEEVRQRFPEAKVLRLDSDTASRKGAHDQVLQAFAQGKADILIGTQMVAKGLDIEKVTVVGILAADAAFNLPDYRSIERGFQLLTQVSGRAGRGTIAGLVVMQTYNTELPALEWASEHNYSKFVQEELESRRSFEYPPFSQITRVVVSGPDENSVQANCERLAEEISQRLEDTVPVASVKVLGPAPCLIEKLRGKYRYHILIKNMAGHNARSLLSDFLRNKRLPSGINMAVDIDALDLL
jgi:primosomal protein N' (replication factor Y)